MKLGVAAYGRANWNKMDGALLKKIADLGFTVSNVLIDDPVLLSDKDVKRLRSIFDDNGITMGQTNGRYGGALVSPDEAERAATVKFLKRMINVSRRLGSPNTYLRPGSLNKRGPWLPHPQNYTDEVFDRLVDSTRQAAKVAENEGVMLAVEGGVVCPLNSPQRVKDFLDAVGSRAVGLNMDPVNFVGTIETAFDTTALLNEFYELLPDRIIGAHAKDFTLVEALLPHFEEEVIGKGMLDQETFLKGMQRVCPKAHVLVEHYPDDVTPVAADGLRAAAKRAGIEWE